MARLSKFIAAAVLAATLPAVAHAAAGVSGIVATRDGTGLPGVRISLVPADGHGSVVVVSGEHGVFRATGLGAGAWTLTASLTGFADLEIDGLQMSDGHVLELDLTLSEVRFRDAVSVIGIAPRDQLTAREIEDLGSREIADALTRLAGMSRLRKGGTATDVVLRGYKEENLNVLVDGVRVHGACPSNMDPSAFHTDISEVDHVELSRGPFDVRNAGSLGGVVNLVTRKPEHGYSGEATLVTGSFGLLSPTVTGAWGSDAVSVLAGVATRRSDPYQDGRGRRFTELANYRSENLDTRAFDSTSGWARVGFTPAGGHSLHVSAMVQRAGQTLYPYLSMDGIWDDTDRINAGWELARDDGTVRAVRAQAYYSRVRHWMTDELRVSSVGAPRDWGMGSRADTDTWGGKVEADMGALTVGVEAVRRRWNVTTSMAGMQYQSQYSVPDVVIDAFGAFAEVTRALSPTVRLDAGLRVDHSRSRADADKAPTVLYWAYNGTRSTSADDTLPSGNVRLVWQAGHGFEVSGGIGRTVRTPDPRERYFGLKRMGSDWVGNPDLGPIRNTGASLQASWRGRGTWANLALFSDRLDGYIVLHRQDRLNTVTGVRNTVATSYANVDARQLGAELSITVSPADALFLSSEVSYVRGSKNRDPALNIHSDVLAQMPPLTSRMAVRWDRGWLFTELEGVFQARQNRVDTDLNEQQTPGFGVANVRIGGRYRGLSATLALDNVFDRYYVEHLSYLRDPFRSGAKVPEPGRSVSLAVSYTL